MEPAGEVSPSSTSIKRKADEAFDALDDALRPTEARPPPPKRANTSIYGSLAKYGILTRSKSSTSKLTSTPTLTALLSRSRSKKNRKPLYIPKISGGSSTAPDYRPSSTEAFLQRLSTYNLSSYSSKPPQIDAVAASKAGWINEGGKDRLYCAICKVGWVVAGREGLSRDAAAALVEKQQKALVDTHKEGCPWRLRQCDSLVYRIPLQSPTGLARQVKARAAELEHVMNGIIIRHPLSSNQVQSFLQIIQSISDSQVQGMSSAASPHTSTTAFPSSTSLLTALFGWALMPALPTHTRHSSSTSLIFRPGHSRASSVQSIPGPSRGTSPASTGSNPFYTPMKGDKRSLDAPLDGNDNGSATPSRAGSSSPTPVHRQMLQQKDALLQCQMCQRRVGLWAFTLPGPSGNDTPATPQPTSPNGASSGAPQRNLDLLREHRSYCPYVVKSTPLPSLPSYPPSSPAPRSSFNLKRASTSTSLTEDQSQKPTSNLRRTASLLSGVSALARTSTASSIASPPQDSLVEGWRAVFNVILRCGISERSRVRMHFPSKGATPEPVPEAEAEPERREQDEDDAMIGIVALVEGVKHHGGRQLLNYVRGLLG